MLGCKTISSQCVVYIQTVCEHKQTKLRCLELNLALGKLLILLLMELLRFFNIRHCFPNSLIGSCKTNKTLEYNNVLYFGEGVVGNFLDCKSISFSEVIKMFFHRPLAGWQCVLGFVEVRGWDVQKATRSSLKSRLVTTLFIRFGVLASSKLLKGSLAISVSSLDQNSL